MQNKKNAIYNKLRFLKYGIEYNYSEVEAIASSSKL